MARYLFDVDSEIDDCSKCPLFNHDFEHCNYFGLEDYIGFDFEQHAYHVPEWCPLERVSQGGNVATFIIVNSEGGNDEGL